MSYNPDDLPYDCWNCGAPTRSGYCDTCGPEHPQGANGRFIPRDQWVAEAWSERLRRDAEYAEFRKRQDSAR